MYAAGVATGPSAEYPNAGAAIAGYAVAGIAIGAAVYIGIGEAGIVGVGETCTGVGETGASGRRVLSMEYEGMSADEVGSG